MRSQMSSIIEPEHLELFALEFGKIAEYDFVYTQSSTNTNQSIPDLVKMYVTIRSWMSFIMDLIGPELSELSALELENLTVYTLAPANIDQSASNLATLYMPIRYWMSLIMGQIELEHLELLALEFGKIAESDFVYTLASTSINHSVPNLVKMYVTIRSQMSLIMDLIRPELSELSALEFAKIAESDFVNTLAFTYVDQLGPNMVRIYMAMSSWMSFFFLQEFIHSWMSLIISQILQ